MTHQRTKYDPAPDKPEAEVDHTPVKIFAVVVVVLAIVFTVGFMSWQNGYRAGVRYDNCMWQGGTLIDGTCFAWKSIIK